MMENAKKDFFDELLEVGLKRADFAKFYEKGRLRRGLAVALLRIRKSAGLTQSKLGEIVGWKQPYVARLERDNSDALAAIERLEQYSSACGVSTMMLFVDKQTGEVKSSLAIGDSPLIQKLAKGMEGAFPHEDREDKTLSHEKIENNPLDQIPVEPMPLAYGVGGAFKFPRAGFLNPTEYSYGSPITSREKKASRKHSKYSYGPFLKSK